MNGSSCNLSFRLRLLTFLTLILVLSSVLCSATKAEQDVAKPHDPLAEILLRKGILTPDDMRQIDGAATPQQAEELIARILLDKCVLSKSEYEQITGKAPVAQPASAASVAPAIQAQTAAPPANHPAAAAPSAAVLSASSSASAPIPATKLVAATEKPVVPANSAPVAARATANQSESQLALVAVQHSSHPGAIAAPPVAERSPSKAINEALVPVRLLPVDGISRTSLEPAFKAEGVGFTPYGFIRATAIEDSSSPNGDDFPLPGFLTDTPRMDLRSSTSRRAAAAWA